ncbi:MAG TPA: glucosaminidase domain-containing protein [bacterium]|nr:glucosaminidase domain-containing protein [bacterium]
MNFRLLPSSELEPQIQPEFWELLAAGPRPFAASTVPIPPPKPPASSAQHAFFERILPYALETQAMTGIPASVTMAQAALESGWGKHAPGNNFFGIKGRGPAGSQKLWTREFSGGQWRRTLADFRRYHDPVESFLDHALVISEGRYLKHAMQHTGSAKEFVRALQSGKAKYATDPDYENKILGLISRYGLERYDMGKPHA